MEIYQLMDIVTESPCRPDGMTCYVSAALTLCQREIARCGVEVTKAYSHKGTLTLEVERGPVCKLEVEHWKQLLQFLAASWSEVTDVEAVAEFRTDDGWYAQEIAQLGIF